jgi:hypothetical protein
VREVSHIGAAVFLSDSHAQQSEITELAPHIHGKCIVGINLGGPRRQLFLNKLVNRVTQHIDFFTQSMIKRGVRRIHDVSDPFYLGCRYPECRRATHQGARKFDVR